MIRASSPRLSAESTPEGSDALTRPQAAFQQLFDEIDSLPAEALRPIDSDIRSAVSRALGALPELESYALALAHAHAICLATSLSPEGLGALLDEAMCARDLLEAELQSLAASGVVPASRIAELEGSLCRRGVAFDVALFVGVFREHWSAIDGNSVLTWGDLYELELLSDRLLAALSLRNRSDQSTPDASLQRQRAFSLLIHASERARRTPTPLA